MKILPLTLGVVFLALLPVAAAAAVNLDEVVGLIETPADDIDLLQAKARIDAMIDPAFRPERTVRAFERLAAKLTSIVPTHVSPEVKLALLKQFLYESGPWNDHKAFGYDVSNPDGTKIRNKLLAVYIETKLGNCISMPILFMLLGQRLGLPMTLATAPNHMMVKYQHPKHGWVNIETTSGGNFSRDAWQRQLTPMTALAIEKGTYLKPLDKHETVMAMLSTLLEQVRQDGDAAQLRAVSTAILEHEPDCLFAILQAGMSYWMYWNSHCVFPVGEPVTLTTDERQKCEWHARHGFSYEHRAKALGWRMPTEDDKKAYAQRIAERMNQDRN